MKAKFSMVFDDEILESKKQVGCIGGIFQLFDCQQLLGQGYRRDVSGHTQVLHGNQRPDFSLDKNKIRRYQENSRDSMESSRTSFSSSYSTFSSIENKSQQEQRYTHHTFLSRSPRNSPRSPVFKDIIKESIHKDFPSKQIISDDDNNINRVMKHIQSSKTMDQSKLNGIDESLKILFKLKESPKFSYDGLEISKTFIDMKQASKYSSRQSLDCKEDSPRHNMSLKSAQKKLNNSNNSDNSDNRRASSAKIQLQHMEINQRHPSIVAKLMGLETLDERKLEKPLHSPTNSTNMKQQIESLEERLKKVENIYSHNELHKFKDAIMESKKNGKTKLSSVNSLEHKLNKANISEEAFKCPIVIIEPATNFNFSLSKAAKVKGKTDLRNIRTTSSSNRKKDTLNAQINTISPRLQQIKSGKKKKAYASIPLYVSNKTQRLVNSQTSESVSPRCKLRQKQSKVQDIKLQNSSDQANVEAFSGTSSIEHKYLFEKSIRTPTTKFNTEDLIQEDKLRDCYAKELQIALLPRWRPNFVVDTLLKQDGLPHFPVSSSNVIEEHHDLPSDCSFNTGSQTHTNPPSLSSRNNLQKEGSIENICCKARICGRTNEDIHATNEYTSEKPQKNRILHKQSDLLSKFDPLNSNSSSIFFEMSNHQKPTSDVVNEILEQKMVAFGSHDYHIKCHQICKEEKDEKSLIQKNFLLQSQVWDSFKSEVPVIVLEIEKLIFMDLINEVVKSEIAVVLKTKQKQLKKQLLARNGINIA